MTALKLKVCGMKDLANIKGLIALEPHFMGFIFYDKSPRHAGDLQVSEVASIPGHIWKVGVFVNAALDEICEKVSVFELDFIQLHGDEDVAFVKVLKARNFKVIKVFRISDSLPEDMSAFEGLVDYFLFDTVTKQYGGSGQHFDWSVLQDYMLETPYLLSGGIGEEDVNSILKMKLKGLVGLDVNSKVEIKPGFKNLKKIKELRDKL